MLNTMSRRMPQKDVVLARRQVEGMIADGRTVIIVDGKVLKVDALLKYHPGGDKPIRHMVGRDATDEVNAYGNLGSNWYKASLIQPLIDCIHSRPVSTCQNFRWAGSRDDGETFCHQYKAASSGPIRMLLKRPARIQKTKILQLGAAPPKTLHYSIPLMVRVIAGDGGVATTRNFMKSPLYLLYRRLNRLQAMKRANFQQWTLVHSKRLISILPNIQH